MGKKHGKNQWEEEEGRDRGRRNGGGEPEELTEYIRVISPGSVVVVLSLLILLVAMIIWGFTGTLPVTETVTGLVINTAQYRDLFPEDELTAADGYEEPAADGNEKPAAAGNEEPAADGSEEASADGNEEPAADGDEEGEILILCFIDASRYNGQAIREIRDQASLKMADQAAFSGTIDMRVKAPISMEEAKKILFDNEWVLERCVRSNYNWVVVIRPDEDLSRYAYTLADVTLLTDEVAPIRFLMN